MRPMFSLPFVLLVVCLAAGANAYDCIPTGSSGSGYYIDFVREGRPQNTGDVRPIIGAHVYYQGGYEGSYDQIYEGPLSLVDKGNYNGVQGDTAIEILVHEKVSESVRGDNLYRSEVLIVRAGHVKPLKINLLCL